MYDEALEDGSANDGASEGGGAMNSIHFDDGAGRQLMSINAGYDKNLTVANNRFTQTANAETKTIHGSQSHSTGISRDTRA